MTLLHQTLGYKDELETKSKYCDQLLLTNRQLELDLSMVLRQNDYVEDRVPKIQKTFEGYQRQDIAAMDAQQSEFDLNVEETNSCSLPDQEGVQPVSHRFVWEELSVDARCRRANQRSHIICDLENMEPNFTNHAFDFYGTYVRISETQKFKYAETKLINFYKAIVDEVMEAN